MIRYLCLSVTFLDPLFHGRRDGDEPEWPPSPFRLFQALLAGARIGWRSRNWSDLKAEAFRWLERQDPPEILAPKARACMGYTFYVPNNDADAPGKFDREKRLTSKAAIPHRLLDGDRVHYVWPIPESEWPHAQSHVEVLCAEARHLLALGWGIDQVAGHGRVLTPAQAHRLDGIRWRPTRAMGDSGLRVPAPGSLDDLLAVYQSSSNRVRGKDYFPPYKPRVFSRVAYMPPTVLPPRPFAAFELPERLAFPQTQATVVAAMLRSLACRAAQNDTHSFPGGTERYVAGHVKNRRTTPARFSYLPLPTIGHEHADGMIRRLLIAEPYAGDGTHAQWAQRRLRYETLTSEDGTEYGPLLDLWRGSSKRVLGLYSRPSDAWASVTPVVLPGYDDFKSPGKHDEKSPLKAEKLFLKALCQAGVPLDAISDISLRKAPFWPGSQHPTRYRRPNYLRHFPAWHVYLRFRGPVPGPLAIGPGRHCGLGLFAAWEA